MSKNIRTLKFPPKTTNDLKSFWINNKTEEDEPEFIKVRDSIVSMILSGADDSLNLKIDPD
jgi:hypothetical protein